MIKGKNKNTLILKKITRVGKKEFQENGRFLKI